MARIKEPKISEELAFFLKPLTKEERTNLRQSIIEEGVREPIIIWEETGFIIDGHNRWDICKELKINCPTRVMSFKNIDEVKDWMAQNQLGRRNVTEEVKAFLRGKEYLSTKNTVDLRNLNGSTELDENGLPICQSDNLGENTAQKLARKHGVSASTIIRDAAFAQGVEASPDKAEILAGTSGKTMTEVRNAAPVFCRSCRISTPKKDCQDCADLRGGKPRKPPKRKKAGAMKYDWKVFKDVLGRYVRCFDAIKAAYECESLPEFKETFSLLGKHVAGAKALEKVLTKGA